MSTMIDKTSISPPYQHRMSVDGTKRTSETRALMSANDPLRRLQFCLPEHARYGPKALSLLHQRHLSPLGIDDAFQRALASLAETGLHLRP
jgi:hypothetical protein